MDDTIDPVDACIGARLRARRRELRLSQTTLGDVLGVTFQQVQKYERGVNRVSLSAARLFAARMGVDVAYFLEGLPDADVTLPPEGEQDRVRREFMGSRTGVDLIDAALTLPTGLVRALERHARELGANLRGSHAQG